MAILIRRGSDSLGSRLARTLPRSWQRVVITGRGTAIRITRDDVGLRFRTWPPPTHVMESIKSFMRHHVMVDTGNPHHQFRRQPSFCLGAFWIRLISRVFGLGSRFMTVLSPKVSPYALSKHQSLASVETNTPTLPQPRGVL